MINRAKMPRQMYGLGSLVRKLIPNELANIASKAAPFVAMIPGQQGTAALMRGIGRYDKRGNLGDAIKQGALTFVGGNLFNQALVSGGLRNPNASGIGEFFNEETRGRIGGLFDKFQTEDKKVFGAEDALGGEYQAVGPKKNLISVARDMARAGIEKLPDGVVAQLTAGGITAGASLLASYFQGEFEEQQPGETTAEYMERRREYVGQQMRVYMDNYYANDPEYMKLDNAGRDALVARYNLQSGGMPTGIMRTNKAGVMERDYRDKGGFVPVGVKEKADDVPAMLSKNEFVFTADAVRGAGGGNIEKGAQRMYDTMKKLENRVA
jgi:hypothetical protein